MTSSIYSHDSLRSLRSLRFSPLFGDTRDTPFSASLSLEFRVVEFENSAAAAAQSKILSCQLLWVSIIPIPNLQLQTYNE